MLTYGLIFKWMFSVYWNGLWAGNLIDFENDILRNRLSLLKYGVSFVITFFSVSTEKIWDDLLKIITENWSFWLIERQLTFIYIF